MSNQIEINAKVNSKEAIKELEKISSKVADVGKQAKKTQKQISQTGKSGSVKGNLFQGMQNQLIDALGNKISSLDKFGITDAIHKLSQMPGISGKIGTSLINGGRAVLGAAVNPFTLSAIAGIAPFAGMYLTGKNRAEQGKALFNGERTLEQRLGNIQKNQGGTGFVKGLTKDLQDLAIKGKIPLEELTKSASRMMLAFKGNQSEVKKWVSIIADMAAATGESTDFFADLIARAEQFGTVEASVLTQMNEKGIPIFAQLGELLGVSTEQAKKLAEQGKITAEQFKQAATAAHKISVAGANQNNVLKDAAYYEKQTKYLQDEMYAQTYTKQLEAMETRRAKKRFEKEKAYYDDPDIQNFHEEWARLCVGLIEVGEMLKDGLADVVRGISSVTSDLYNWLDDKVNGTQDFKAINSTNNLLSHTNGLDLSARFHGVSLSELAYGMEDANSVVKLSEKIEQLKSGIKDTEKRIANSYVDDENRKAGEDAIARAKEQLAILEATLEKKQKDIAAEKERQRLAKVALELQTKALTSDPQNNTDFIKAWNLNNTNRFQNVEAVRTEFDAANQRIRTGKGTEQDAAFIQFFKPMFDRIEKENERQAQLSKSRENFILQQRAKSGNADARMQLEFGSMVEQMKKLEFGESEINEFVNKQTADAIKNRENKIGGLQGQAEGLQNQIQLFEAAIAKSATCFKTDVYKKTSYERGAWGQGLAIAAPDTAAFQAAQQIKAMKDTNNKLQEQINLFKCEINAIKKLNLTPRAI